MNRVLIANRGEIACRVIRSCKALGLETVAVYSEADADALHVELADRAEPIGPAAARQSYLNMEAVLAAARAAQADAIHPGYGFLAENPRFAERVIADGLIWIGPRPKTIEDMGDKERARLLAKAAGVPVLPGSPRFGPHDVSGLEEEAERVGYPLLVKAAAGGGGIGMQRVDGPEKLAGVVELHPEDGRARVRRRHRLSRAAGAQGAPRRDPGVRLRQRPRGPSVRARVLDPAALPEDHRGDARRPACRTQTRQRMAQAAAALAAQERYAGAGTVEFVVDAETGEFFFLEMNTRIQVEHPVTEMTTGIDLVESADPPRPRRRSLGPDPGEHHAAGRRDRMPALCREPGPDVPALARQARHLQAARAVAGIAHRCRRARGRSDHAALRSHDRQADRARGRSGRGDRTLLWRPCAPSRSRAFTAMCHSWPERSSIRRSLPATCIPASSRRTGRTS